MYALQAGYLALHTSLPNRIMDMWVLNLSLEGMSDSRAALISS